MAKLTSKIFWAIVLVLAATAIILNALNIGINFSVVGIIILVLLGLWVLKSIGKGKWNETLIPLSLVPYALVRWDFIPKGQVYDVLDQLTPWPLLAAAILLSIAFGLLFKKNHVHFRKGRNNFGSIEGANNSYSDDGEIVELSNNFGETVKYVNSTSFKKALIDNNFGQVNVYFNNAIVSPEGATISLDNNFGESNIFIPGNWRVQVKRDNSFGGIKEIGSCNADMDAPLVTVIADTSFGDINIHYI